MTATFARIACGSLAAVLGRAFDACRAGRGLIPKKRLSARLAMEAVVEAVSVCRKAGYAVSAVIVDTEGVRRGGAPR